LSLAKELIKAQDDKVCPEKFTDDYEEAIMRLLSEAEAYSAQKQKNARGKVST